MKIWKKIIIFWGKCRLTLKGIAMCKSRIRTCVLHNKLVLSSLIEILHFMIIDCSSGWINEYYIFGCISTICFDTGRVLQYRKSFAIQIFLSFIKNRWQDTKKVTWCIGSWLQIHFDAYIHHWMRNCILNIVSMFDNEIQVKLQFNCQNEIQVKQTAI